VTTKATHSWKALPCLPVYSLFLNSPVYTDYIYIIPAHILIYENILGKQIKLNEHVYTHKSNSKSLTKFSSQILLFNYVMK
jgi:hypothetical protein